MNVKEICCENLRNKILNIDILTAQARVHITNFDFVKASQCLTELTKYTQTNRFEINMYKSISEEVVK